MGTPGRPRDPRGRPFKMFTAIVDMSDGLKLVRVRAHDGTHASELASKQIKRTQQGTAWHNVRLVLCGYPKEAMT
jgi:hypothetical protein